ncbi:MAG TPA: gamma-glutamyl-gamma-aminobutyrate hydrolase family protein, partial [Kiritimatiellia bacterium]
MKWLMLHPEDAPSRPVYLAWLARLGQDADIFDPRAPRLVRAEDYAGLILTGGGDVEPRRYGAVARHHNTSGVDANRDQLEVDLLGMFIDEGRPIFGICRGQQVLNVA